MWTQTVHDSIIILSAASVCYSFVYIVSRTLARFDTIIMASPITVHSHPLPRPDGWQIPAAQGQEHTKKPKHANSKARKQQNKMASRRYSRHALDPFVVPEEVFTVAFVYGKSANEAFSTCSGYSKMRTVENNKQGKPH